MRQSEEQSNGRGGEKPRGQLKGQLKGQLSLRGIVIGCVGCVVITAASVYTALKMGALPWPIIFAALVSLFFLKLLGRTNLNEANVTHTVMSAGAMVGGGLAFTIPGIWMLGHADEVSWWQMLLVALAGVSLGLMCTVLLRRYFVERAALPFPVGEAAAQTLVAGDTGGTVGAKLFGALGFAGIYTFLRDALGVIPAMLAQTFAIPGVAFGIYNSPMLLAVGFLVGTGAVFAWFGGALLGHFGLVLGGSSLGWWDIVSGQGIGASLGMGLMMGAGVGVIVRIILPRRKASSPTPATTSSPTGSLSSATASSPTGSATPTPPPNPLTSRLRGLLHAPEHASSRTTAALTTLLMAAAALILCFALQLGILASVIVVALVWLTTAMSSQSVGQTGIDPMEIFGLIALLIVAACAPLPTVQLFFVAAIVAVACGLAGDVMNDFKAGHILGTNPRAQWIGQAIGGVLGAGVAVGVMVVLLSAYGADAFGPQGSFVSAQASIVATMVSGIPSVPAFGVGVLIGFVLSLVGLPAMMIGLGIYLPFYLSFTAFLGAVAKLVYDRVGRVVQARTRARKQAAQGDSPPPDELEQRKRSLNETGLVIASGLLGGESVVGVLVALSVVLSGIGG